MKPDPAMMAVEPAAAKAAYEEECSQCHELSDVDAEPPTKREDIDPLFERMVENGMEIDDPATIAQIKAWLLNHFVTKQWK